MSNRGILAWLVLMAVVMAGCSQSASNTPATSGEGAASAGTNAAGSAKDDTPFVLGDLIKPFKAPTLEELDKQAQWIDQPVLDSLVLLRQRQKGEKPLVTTEEALRLKNDSKEANAKILSALGRLPDDDKQVNWDASIFRWEATDVKSTNPLMASSTVESDVNGLTSFGLFSYNWDFVPFASKDSVVSWQTSKDRMYDKVVIRDDLTWSDGKPITAHDVVFSFKAIMSERVPVPAVRSGTDKLKWIEAYDDHTLVFFHQEPSATNVWNLNFPVIPKHIYETSIAEDPTLQNSPYHVKCENNPVSGGSYIITSRTRSKEIVLKRRDDYYMHNGKQVRDKPQFKEIRFRIISDPSVALLALKKGDIEEMILDPEQWQTQTGGDDFYAKNTKARAVEWTSFHFCWNLKTPYFSDVRVRKAMSYAFNYKEMFDKLLYGLNEPCTGIFHQASRWASKKPLVPYKQDLDRAEKLLDEAGWSDHDGDGIRDKEINGRRVPLEFSMLVSTMPWRVAICNLLKENLDQIGVICNVRPMEFTVLQEKTQNHEFQAYMGGWGTGADPDTSENIWGTDQGRNFGYYSNPEVDRLFAEARKEFDVEKRAAIYQKIDELIYEDQPYSWLFYRNAFYGFNKNLRGYVFSPRGPYSYGPGFGSIWKPAAAK
jgi:peptide/nickel transport system substrate-binding protein